MDGWRGAGLQGQTGEDPRHQVHQGLENSLSLPKIAMSVHDLLVTSVSDPDADRQKNESQKIFTNPIAVCSLCRTGSFFSRL